MTPAIFAPTVLLQSFGMVAMTRRKAVPQAMSVSPHSGLITTSVKCTFSRKRVSLEMQMPTGRALHGISTFEIPLPTHGQRYSPDRMHSQTLDSKKRSQHRDAMFALLFTATRIVTQLPERRHGSSNSTAPPPTARPTQAPTLPQQQRQQILDQTLQTTPPT